MSFAPLLTLFLAVTTSLSQLEQRTVANCDRVIPAERALLRQIVEINSGTKNLEGVRQVGKVLSPKFEALGFQTRWVPQDEVHRAGHLIATHPCPTANACGKRILLIGHMDTVFEPESGFLHYSENGNTATGPGVDDMKGGLVVMLGALEAMQQAGALAKTEITVVLSGDEEASGQPTSISRRDLVAAAQHSDVALEFEATATDNGRDYGSTARRGSLTWTLDATGQTGHSSGVFGTGLGDGAIYELARILDAFHQQLREPNLTYSVGLVLGGSIAQINQQETGGTANGKPNIVPAQAIAIGDLRALTPEQVTRVQAKMQAIVAQHLPKTDAKITFGEAYPPMAPTEGNRALLRLTNEVNRDLGLPEQPELDPMKRGAGDISFVAQYVSGLAGVGSVGAGSHAPGETMDLSALPRLTKRAAILMERLPNQMPLP